MYERVYVTQAFIKRFKAVKKVQNYTFYFKNDLGFTGLKLINPCAVKVLLYSPLNGLCQFTFTISH